MSAHRMWARRLIATALAATMGGCSPDRDPPSPAPEPAASAPESANQPAATTEAAAPAPPPAAPSAATDHPYAKPSDYTAKPLSTVELPSGLIIDDLKVGDGQVCLPKALVTFHYRAKVKDGQEFDATAERPDGAAPETASLGRIMKGLQDGMVGMKAGGRRRLTIPPDLAFGWIGAKDPAGNETVPPHATVVFVIDLLDSKLTLMPAGAPAVPSPSPGGGTPK